MNKLNVLKYILKLSAQVLKDWEEAAREFGEDPISEDEYLEKITIKPKIELKKQYIGTGEKFIQEALSRKGIILTSNEMGAIGSGSFANIYRCVYKGKPAVIKIYSNSSGYQSKDVENIKNLNLLLRSAPDYVKNVVPKIYLAEKLELPRQVRAFSVFIVVSEELYPVGKSIKKEIEGIPKDEKDILSVINHVKNNLYNIIVNNIEKLSETIKYFFPKNTLNNDDLLEISKKLTYNYFKIISSESFLEDLVLITNDKSSSELEIRSLIIKAFSFNLIPDGKLHFKRWIKNNIRESIANKVEGISDYIYDYYQSCLITALLSCSILQAFPIMASEQNKDYTPSEYLSDFYRGISWLREHGYQISDIHSQNIMMDRNHNIKIVDFGYVESEHDQLVGRTIGN